MDTGNFLPNKLLMIEKGQLWCPIRNKRVSASPEEKIRYRVLSWLIEDKKWKEQFIKVEKNYKWLGDPNRSRIRADIVLLDENRNDVKVVVECKHAGCELGDEVATQAKEYALKAHANWIWLTNGDSHRFLKREDSNSSWKEKDKLSPLDVSAPKSAEPVAVPSSTNDKSLKKYWDSLAKGDSQWEDFHQTDNDIQKFTLAVHKIIFEQARYIKLPIVRNGFYILERRGSSFYQVRNKSGGSYYARYANFIAGTSAGIKGLSIAVNTYKTSDDIRLCVRVADTGKHVLQLDPNLCEMEFDKDDGYWNVYHKGAMADIKIEEVLEAVREAQAHRLICNDGERDWIYLGKLPMAESKMPKKSREFLENLLHYALIRAFLREADRARNASKKQRARKKSGTN